MILSEKANILEENFDEALQEPLPSIYRKQKETSPKIKRGRINEEKKLH